MHAGDTIVVRGRWSRRPVSALVALGSNLGDRLGNLPGRRHVRRAGHRGHCGSHPSGSQSVPEDQPSYPNAVIGVETPRLRPGDSSPAAKEIERALRRRRKRRWGPRPANLDIQFYGQDAVLNLPKLRVPHPRILQRIHPGPLARALTGELPAPQDDGD
ncbi:2-amino-4-hydroxy-6-hydroxymethyldihydropteridine diphosphokinase [Candidatus Amarobacter glycogenicus]|uniref:2-amino-4-hydroxy-6- hydroxymethyldihydropteridine diphosphokinase n=1 Tax=Candidatus Amarobacter glycogenicus TaxID=3140699 RepID=UPI002A0C429E|nr:2-amino-4-hydroxy-6-hydroxymethyldihydropteridine diphosphokinase [Dehalococcoidia bacterium]